jgi:pyruvate dehydrogenase (quinone)
MPVKVLFLNNGRLAKVAFEQWEAGFGVFGCELSAVDFVAYAKACGPDGFRCEKPEEIGPAIMLAFPFPQTCDRRGKRRSRRAASQTR